MEPTDSRSNICLGKWKSEIFNGSSLELVLKSSKLVATICWVPGWNEGMTPTNHALGFPLGESHGSFPTPGLGHSLPISPANVFFLVKGSLQGSFQLIPSLSD